jgi:hypothetical protein
MDVTIDQISSQPRPQRFYCPGCQEYHETESLLEAVRAEAEKIRQEQNNDEQQDA